MITDDPGTPGDRHWEINTAFTTERRSGEHTYEMPLLDLNYGIGDRLQLKYDASWLRISNDTGRHDGFSNSLIGVKWRFYEAGEKAWRVSTYPQLKFNNPGSHSDERGLAEHGTTFMVPFEVAKDFGAFSFNVDVGFVHHPDENEWFGGVAIGHEITHGVELAAELHWGAAAHFRETELTADIGARLALSEKFTLLVSIGRDLRDRRGSKATLIAYFGLQTRL